MLNFKDFLNEKNIEVGKNLEDKLSQLNISFSQKLLDFLNSDDVKDEFGYAKIDWDDKDSNLLTLIDDKGKKKKIKLGKLLNMIGFNKDYKQYELEEFISNIKDIKTDFKILKGEDIRWAYHCKNYAVKNPKSPSGDLNESCMMLDMHQKFLDIYTKNPDKVSLIVDLKDGKVDGRALLWTMDDGSKYMDRVYTNNKEDHTKFHSYANKNNISSKASTVTLDTKGDYDYYPYMDTFRFYYPEQGIVSQSSLPYKPELHLLQKDGSAQRISKYTLTDLIKERNIESFDDITEFDCSGKDITSMDGIEKMTNLKKLSCGSNYINSLDLTELTSLEYLDCSNNNLMELDLKNNTKLKKVYCFLNEINTIELNSSVLEVLDISNNTLVLLDLSNTDIKSLFCNDNYLTHLVLPEDCKLEEIEIDNNIFDPKELYDIIVNNKTIESINGMEDNREEFLSELKDELSVMEHILSFNLFKSLED